MRIIFFAMAGVMACLFWGSLWPVSIKSASIGVQSQAVEEDVTDIDVSAPLKPFAAYASILERPLFEPSRQKLVSDGTNPASVTGASVDNKVDLVSPRSSLRISGRVSTGRYTKVLLKFENSSEEAGVWRAAGEVFEGGQVQKIESQTVTLLLNGEEIVLPIALDAEDESDVR